MYVSYRNTKLDLGQVPLAISRQPTKNQAGEMYAYDEVWRLGPALLLNKLGGAVSSNLLNMRTLILKLEDLFSVDGGDLRLLQPDGVGLTAHNLLSANCIGGVRVTMPVSYPEGNGAEHITYRTWVCELTGTVPAGNASTGIFSHTYEIRKQGGGPLFGYLLPLVGEPIGQTRKQQTLYTATQSGRIVGTFAKPTIADVPPIWPQFLKSGMPITTRGSPRPIGGGGFVEFPLNYTYEYESPIPLLD